MITKIEVNGFKSLLNFNLKLNQGLNILVGPNGAGKTNIILFFEFLSNLARHQIGNAISNVGGAGAIFEKIGRDKYSNEIVCIIHGTSQTGPKRFMVYEYSFTIQISFEKDNVYFSHQSLKIRNSTKFLSDPDIRSKKPKWPVHLEFKATEDLKTELDFVTLTDRKFVRRFLPQDIPQKEQINQLKIFISQQVPLYHSLAKCIFPFAQVAQLLYADLIGGETFNVVPSKVRELEDSATPPGIKKDGSGLATTLYAMKKNRTGKQERGPFYLYMIHEETVQTYSPSTLAKITKFLRAANNTVKSLDVENDPFNNKVVVRITIKSGGYEAVLPLSSMSDGTIKWLTLITAILTSKTIFSIEEPENFLHPWMQAEIVNIMRNQLQEKPTQAFVLMTTHSESLLNNSKPEEVILVGLDQGQTRARRISNVSEIHEEISNSGFGLGHFYFSNALSDE